MRSASRGRSRSWNITVKGFLWIFMEFLRGRFDLYELILLVKMQAAHFMCFQGCQRDDSSSWDRPHPCRRVFQLSLIISPLSQAALAACPDRKWRGAMRCSPAIQQWPNTDASAPRRKASENCNLKFLAAMVRVTGRSCVAGSSGFRWRTFQRFDQSDLLSVDDFESPQLIVKNHRLPIRTYHR